METLDGHKKTATFFILKVFKENMCTKLASHFIWPYWFVQPIGRTCIDNPNDLKQACRVNAFYFLTSIRTNKYTQFQQIVNIGPFFQGYIKQSLTAPVLTGNNQCRRSCLCTRTRRRTCCSLLDSTRNNLPEQENTSVIQSKLVGHEW